MFTDNGKTDSSTPLRCAQNDGDSVIARSVRSLAVAIRSSWRTQCAATRETDSLLHHKASPLGPTNDGAMLSKSAWPEPTTQRKTHGSPCCHTIVPIKTPVCETEPAFLPKPENANCVLINIRLCGIDILSEKSLYFKNNCSIFSYFLHFSKLYHFQGILSTASMLWQTHKESTLYILPFVVLFSPHTRQKTRPETITFQGGYCHCSPLLRAFSRPLLRGTRHPVFQWSYLLLSQGEQTRWLLFPLKLPYILFALCY